MHASKQPDVAVAVLHNDVLPFNRNIGLIVGALLTDNGREFCGRDDHPYQVYLALNEVDHRTTRVGRPQTTALSSVSMALDEFFRIRFLQRFYKGLEALQRDFDEWLEHYTTERPHLGYRNQGRTPWQTIEQYVNHPEEVSA